MTGSSSIAVIANRDGQDNQALLSWAAADWRAAGTHVVGVLAENNSAGGVCSANFMRDIASGRRFSIHLDAPPAGTDCHLDSAGMEEACAALLGQIPQADVVVFSKFGKLEAMGQGLWAAFAAAAAAGKPMLTTVSAKHVDAWTRFAPEALWLNADRPSIERWRAAA